MSAESQSGYETGYDANSNSSHTVRRSESGGSYTFSLSSAASWGTPDDLRSGSVASSHTLGRSDRASATSSVTGSFGYSTRGNSGNGGQEYESSEDGENEEDDGDVFTQSYYGTGSK
jgi:hypothetical protein